MLVSMNWIRDFVDLEGLDIIKLIHQFTLSTAEVEDIDYKGKELNYIVAGKIIKADKHPDSERLSLIKVDTGDRIYECVCGAPDIHEGMVVPFACEGGSIGNGGIAGRSIEDISIAGGSAEGKSIEYMNTADSSIRGMRIKKTVIAGYVSEGMCLSEAELGISGDNSRLMLLEEGVPLGTDVKLLYDLEDIVFEIDNKSLTNRPDLWGHYGIAREFAALAGRKLKKLDVVDSSIYGHLPNVDIKVQNVEDVYRYTGMKISNIHTKESPVNIKIRLTYCGLRPIHLLADLTNYVMLELGQPMHAFDLRKVDCIEVKNFDDEMEFITLDKAVRQITKSALMISSHNKPVAIAGIMGGLDTEIMEDTDSLLLESANFDGICVRKTSSRLGLRTDASMRYEKALDPEMTSTAIERYLRLLLDIDEDVTVISNMTDCYVKRYDKIFIELNKAYVDKYAGIDIPVWQMEATLRQLGFNVEACEKGIDCQGVKEASVPKFMVEVPSFRATKDVTIAADLVEEITRIYGYDNFTIASTNSRLYPAVMFKEKKMEYAVRDILVKRFALHETATYIWTDSRKMKELGIEQEQNVRIINSINPENGILRKSIIPSLLSVLHDNKSYGQEYGIFEIGKVVEGLKEDGLCSERKRLGIVLYDRNHDEKSTFFALRDMVYDLGIAAKNIKLDFRNGIMAGCTDAQQIMVGCTDRQQTMSDCTDVRPPMRYGWQSSVNTADIVIDNMVIGYLSALHPMNKERIDKKASIVMAEIDMELLEAVQEVRVEYKEVSRFPSIEIDLCFVMKEGILFSDIEQEWTAMEFPYLHDYKVIDVYDENVSSITVRFEFISPERTLTHEEVQAFTKKLIDRLGVIGIRIKE